MKIPRKLASLAFCLSVLMGSQGIADSIDTLSSWTGRSFDTFGDLSGNNPGGVTFGETFVIHSGDAYAQNLSFLVDQYYPSPAPEVCTFQAYLMAWNGSRPDGAILFASDPLVTSTPWQTFSVPLGNALLHRDQTYVAFFTANNFLNSIRSDARMGGTDDVYPDGVFVQSYNDFSFDDLFSHDWEAPFGTLFDLALKLDYAAVPEPAPAPLLGVALFGMLRYPRSLGSWQVNALERAQ